MSNMPVTIENARIVFRNFAGKEGKFNKEGDRSFCVLIDHETADNMRADGWNIKELQPREEGDLTQPYLKVKVKFSPNGRPPRMVLVTSRNKTSLGEDDIMIFDWAEIANVDMIIRPYDWEFNGNEGRTAYLKSIFVTIVEDELDRKYADVPDSAQLAIGTGTDEVLEDMGELDEALELESGRF